MLFLRKFLKLPSPVDLGWSHHDALEDEDWSDDPKGKTWQDWDRTVKQMHPVKYFIAETMGDWLQRKWWRLRNPFKDAHYYVVSHVVPSRRYHMLDLRQPKRKGELANIDAYRYGWVDVPEKMLYAMFNLLGEYLNEEQPHDLTTAYTREQIDADPAMKAQQGAVDEARTIYNWWMVGRKQEIKNIDDTRHLWWQSKKAKEPSKDEYWNKLNRLEAEFEAKTDEMVARLMKIRRTLWT